MVVHIMHRALHPFIQPGFQPPCVFVEAFRSGNTAIVESEPLAPLLYQPCMVGSRQISLFCPPGACFCGQFDYIGSSIPPITTHDRPKIHAPCINDADLMSVSDGWCLP